MAAPGFDVNAVRTPYYIVDESLVVKNLEILKSVMDRTGCKILLAQKAFSMFALYPLIGRYLSGATASGLHEARLGREALGKENHVFSAAYRDDEFDEIVELCDHIVFNSFAQLARFKDRALSKGKKIGVRVNPECSTQGHGIYDPCAKGSRLGVTADNFRPELLGGVSGLHFHTLCEQNADALIVTLDAFERKFGQYLNGMEWVNFGGGHHITREDYNIEALVRTVNDFKARYGVQVYLEPGEAVALNAGYLVSTVLDIVDNGLKIAILDASAACHMPDVLEMPYRPAVLGAGFPGEKRCNYRLGGPTCLAGDVIGDYSFPEPLSVGDKLVFCDMAIYSMVKNNTFNGMNLPAIAVKKQDGTVRTIKSFGYEDFKGRLS
ncbi:carboxynorspermidine decarboxylase [Sporobacter termitidis DSM 10068]|uniref:Carboxynorspermidine decarboxylase n=1 Tax=Sporobacter termitidis DSM 10068 TaxID=1123282 RepID=A0A1M5Z6S7_9FIRM|nr:carboxynorspermidine decarboxylase [Sporobacter termitidis]SHI19952.1 carboxynorspermidine decarboxylase [Sporobacter termitidis DSM 10068]